MLLRGNVFSQSLAMDTGITILAPQTEKNMPYQIVYLLHGLCGNNGNWTDNTMLPAYANDYNVLFVMPEVSRSFYTNMQYGAPYFSYITEELPKICKRVFNIEAKRENTGIIGASMGGYGALKCALTKPDQYGFCGALSSVCLYLQEFLEEARDIHSGKWEKIYGKQLKKDLFAIFGTQLKWSPKDEILYLANQISDYVFKPKIYCACGTKDPLHGYNRIFSSEMEKKSFDFTYEEWEGVHNWQFFNRALKRCLKTYFSMQPKVMAEKTV